MEQGKRYPARGNEQGLLRPQALRPNQALQGSIQGPRE